MLSTLVALDSPIPRCSQLLVYLGSGEGNDSRSRGGLVSCISRFLSRSGDRVEDDGGAGGSFGGSSE